MDGFMNPKVAYTHKLLPTLVTLNYFQDNSSKSCIIKSDKIEISKALSEIFTSKSRIEGGVISEFPVWNILNEIYISSNEGRNISISDIGLATGIPMATSIRWLGVLQERNLINRWPDPTDKRRIWLKLTYFGEKCLETWLSDVKLRLDLVVKHTN